MSDYSDEYDDCNAVCPYCGDTYQVEGESYSEDDTDITCDECGKRYYLRQDFSVTHVSTPDCTLNGEQHKWRPINITSGSHDFCSVCDKCRGHDE